MKTTLLVTFISVFIASCTSNKSIDQQINSMHHQFHINSTTQESLAKVTPILENLLIGAPINESELKWSTFDLHSGGNTMGLAIKSEGWLKLLSGGLKGGLSKLGKPIGLQNGKVIGEHIFGYSWANINVVPQYKVETEANLISEDEYHKDSENADWGYISSGNKIYFKDVIIKSVTRMDEGNVMDFESFNLSNIEVVGETALDDKLTEKSYLSVSKAMKSLNYGITTHKVAKILNGIVVKYPSEEAYYIHNIDGLLNVRYGANQPIITKSGIFVIWPFGFVSNGETHIKTVLIFKNGRLFKKNKHENKQKTLELISAY